jgi:hypothetical protein
MGRGHINGFQIITQIMKEPGWWDGIVYRPDAPFADEGRKFIVFRNWDGVSGHWGSGIYDLTLQEARHKLGLYLSGELPKEGA